MGSPVRLIAIWRRRLTGYGPVSVPEGQLTGPDRTFKHYLKAGRWISPAINPFANLTSVFFTAMQADVEDEDVNQSSEMWVYVFNSRVYIYWLISSDQKEELKIFDEIMKLVPSFKEVIMACSEHRRALLNLIRMVC
jgi:hypothetical protein